MSSRWTPEQFWQYAGALVNEFEADQMRYTLAQVGLVLVPSAVSERLTERCNAYKGQVKAGAEEIERLQHAKRRALQIADERSKENVELRSQLGNAEATLFKLNSGAELQDLMKLNNELRNQLEHYEWGRKNTQIEMDEREAVIDRLTNQLVKRTEALKLIRDEYDHQDLNHVDFRVNAYRCAIDALTDDHGAEK